MFSGKRLLCAGALTLMIAGCGPHDDNDGGFETTPGVGSGTLTVDALIDVSEDNANGQTATDFTSDLEVDITKQGAAVAGATVVISSAAGQVTLTETGQAGQYRASMSGYSGAFGLDIVSGDDNVIGAKLVGPQLHVIAAPVHDSVHPLGDDLTVEWAPGGATSASIETSDTDEFSVPDTGSYLLPASALPGDPGNMADDEVIVRRSHEVQLGGAVPGSTLRVEIRNMVDFQLDGT